MEKVYEYLRSNIGLKLNDTVVIAVSGGPDSMCLLNLLTTLKTEMNINIVCAHVNHNVRKESAYEKSFVEEYCISHGITFEYMKIKEYGEDNFHNEARSKRYEYFNTMMKKYGSKILLTAHHADDLIETILMRIVRGSTLRGYSGFSKVVKMENYVLIRPLIEVTKDEVFKYCKKNNLKFMQDKSNSKDIYTRNRFRKYIVPLFKKEDKFVDKKFMQFSNTLLEYDDYINKDVIKVLEKAYLDKVLNLEIFRQQHNVIQTKILNNILETIYADDLMLITNSHVELIKNLINSTKPNVYVFLPNSIKVIKSYNNLKFEREFIDIDSYEVELINYVNLPNGKNLEIVSNSESTSNNTCRLNSKNCTLPLIVRNRKQGDKLTVKGMLGSKKLKDIFIDEKISTEERDVWPVVVDSEDNIVWLPGLKKTKYDVDKDMKYDIIIKYY